MADGADINPVDLGFPTEINGRDPSVLGYSDGNIGLQGGTIDWLVTSRRYASQDI